MGFPHRIKTGFILIWLADGQRCGEFNYNNQLLLILRTSIDFNNQTIKEN